jgi:hypothetical protein
MSVSDKPRTLVSVAAIGPEVIRLHWSDRTQADLKLGAVLEDPAFAPLRDPVEFAKVEVGEWGHSLAWPSGPELGADGLWLETLWANRRGLRTGSDLDPRARS